MANNRIYYAIQQVAIQSQSKRTWYPVKGLQSVGVTTNFALTQAYELGQQSIYENIEEIPDVQIALKKVLDGYPPIYCLATMDATTPTLAARSIQRCNVNMSIYDESSTYAVGAPVGMMEASGLYLSSIRYNFPKDGNFEEDVTLVGNDKIWKNDSRLSAMWAAWVPVQTGQFNGLDSPIGVGGVNRRQDLKLGNSTSGSKDTNGMVADADLTVLPPDIAGIDSSGCNNMSDNSRAHLSNISISVNLNRDNLTELGRRGNYCRIPNFPVEVSTEVGITASSGDLISATESGILTTAAGCGNELGNLTNATIRVATCEGLRLYTGVKNKLASVNYTGGEAGGKEVTVSYTFTTFNDFVALHSGETTLTGFLTYGPEAGVTATGFWKRRGEAGWLIN